MPRKPIREDDDEMPRRRRGARAVALEADAERGLVMRVLLHSPKDTVAGALAFVAVCAIVANALFLQTGHHPAPMFGSVIVMPAPAVAPVSLLPRPRPADASLPDLKPAFEPKPAFELKPASESKLTSEPKPALEPRPAPEPKPAETKGADPLGNLVKTTTAAPVAPPSNILRPPAPIPLAGHGERRIAAVQRALTKYGYGQLQPTGTIGTDTQAAIVKFERSRKLPVTGQMSDRLVHELTAVTGHPVE